MLVSVIHHCDDEDEKNYYWLMIQNHEDIVMNFTEHTAKMENGYLLFDSNDLQILDVVNCDVKKRFCQQHTALTTEISKVSNSIELEEIIVQYLISNKT